jgi:hypothetical protein
MRSLSKFLLDLLMDFDVSLQSLNLCLHFVVLEEQLLSLLGLILELSSELVVLEDSEASGGLELLVVKSEQVSFGLLDLVKHVLPEFLCRLDLLPLLFIDFVDPLLLLIVPSSLVLLEVVSQLYLFSLEILNVLIFCFLILIFKSQGLVQSSVILVHFFFFRSYIIL